MRIAHNLAIDYFRRERDIRGYLEDGSNVFNTLDFSEDWPSQYK